jgi:hypothetical protein
MALVDTNSLNCLKHKKENNQGIVLKCEKNHLGLTYIAFGDSHWIKWLVGVYCDTTLHQRCLFVLFLHTG